MWVFSFSPHPDTKKRKPLTSVSLFSSLGNWHPYPDAPMTIAGPHKVSDTLWARHIVSAYHQRTKVVMRLNFSYVSLALVTSSADTGVGCSRLYLKRSTSFPFNTGVSLIGLAMINTYLCEISLQRYEKFVNYERFEYKKWRTAGESASFYHFRLAIESKLWWSGIPLLCAININKLTKA